MISQSNPFDNVLGNERGSTHMPGSSDKVEPIHIDPDSKIKFYCASGGYVSIYPGAYGLRIMVRTGDEHFVADPQFLSDGWHEIAVAMSSLLSEEDNTSTISVHSFEESEWSAPARAQLTLSKRGDTFELRTHTEGQGHLDLTKEEFSLLLDAVRTLRKQASFRA